MATVVLAGPIQYTRIEPLTQFVAKHCRRCVHGAGGGEESSQAEFQYLHCTQTQAHIEGAFGFKINEEKIYANCMYLWPQWMFRLDSSRVYAFVYMYTEHLCTNGSAFIILHYHGNQTFAGEMVTMRGTCSFVPRLTHQLFTHGVRMGESWKTLEETVTQQCST